MSFITYVLSTILLSWVGMLVYAGFRWTRPGAQARRGMIWLVVLLSLTIPLTPGFFQHSQPNEAAISSHLEATTGAVISPVPVGSANINDFCHCAQPHAGDRILYQTSLAYDWVLANRQVLGWLQILVSVLIVLRLTVRLGRLMRVTWRHRKQKIEIEGRKVWLVKGVPRLTAGSLRFGSKFIFWHDSLDRLPAPERKAILWHEYAHIRQCNTWEKLFLGLLQSIWLLNPVYYFLSRELELLSEYIADDYAASRHGDRKEYARLLLTVKGSRDFAPVHFFKGSRLKARVREVLGKKDRPRIHYLPAFVIGLLLLFPGEFFAENLIQEQIRDIEVYKLLSDQNHETGKTEFCKKCTYEAVEAACY